MYGRPFETNRTQENDRHSDHEPSSQNLSMCVYIHEIDFFFVLICTDENWVGYAGFAGRSYLRKDGKGAFKRAAKSPGSAGRPYGNACNPAVTSVPIRRQARWQAHRPGSIPRFCRGLLNVFARFLNIQGLGRTNWVRATCRCEEISSVSHQSLNSVEIWAGGHSGKLTKTCAVCG